MVAMENLAYQLAEWLAGKNDKVTLIDSRYARGKDFFCCRGQPKKKLLVQLPWKIVIGRASEEHEYNQLQ